MRLTTRPILSLSLVLLAAGAALAEDTYLGRLSVNPNLPDSTANPYGVHGSRFSPVSIHNPYGRWGSRFSPESATNPHATSPPLLVGE